MFGIPFIYLSTDLFPNFIIASAFQKSSPPLFSYNNTLILSTSFEKTICLVMRSSRIDREELHDFKDKVLCMLINIPKHFIIILYTMHYTICWMSTYWGGEKFIHIFVFAKLYLKNIYSCILHPKTPTHRYTPFG